MFGIYTVELIIKNVNGTFQFRQWMLTGNAIIEQKLRKPIKLGEQCPKCRKLLRPDVVWFGEAVDMRVDTLYEIVSTIDIFIGVGTSAQVYPAANLLKFFGEVKEKYFIDPNPAYEVLNGFTVIKGTASQKIPQLVEQLISQ